MCTDTSSKMWWPEDRIREQKRGDDYGIAAKFLPSDLQRVGFKFQVDFMMLDTLWKPYKLTTVPNGFRVVA